jgi:predicted CoA-binding protein
MPREPEMDEEQIIQRLLDAQRIAVVGLSDDPSRPSFYVSKYMEEQGKEIVPVNPSHQSVFGVDCYPSLDSVPGPIDLVNVFRRPLACPDVVRAAIKKGVKGVWLQSGITSTEAARLAREAGLDYIEDRCIMIEHRRHRR